jgi:hypothetical protein
MLLPYPFSYICLTLSSSLPSRDISRTKLTYFRKSATMTNRLVVAAVVQKVQLLPKTSLAILSLFSRYSLAILSPRCFPDSFPLSLPFPFPISFFIFISLCLSSSIFLTGSVFLFSPFILILLMFTRGRQIKRLGHFPAFRITFTS